MSRKWSQIDKNSQSIEIQTIEFVGVVHQFELWDEKICEKWLQEGLLKGHKQLSVQKTMENGNHGALFLSVNESTSN